MVKRMDQNYVFNSDKYYRVVLYKALSLCGHTQRLRVIVPASIP